MHFVNCQYMNTILSLIKFVGMDQASEIQNGANERQNQASETQKRKSIVEV